MDSTMKGFLFIGLGVISLIWFAYETYNYLDVWKGRAPEEGLYSVSVTLIGLKLVMAILFFFSGIKSLRKKD